MKEDIILGCDIGTGSCKAVAFSASGKVIADSQYFYEVQHPQQGYSEQDADMIIQSFYKCIKALLPKLPSKPVAAGLSSCMHSLVLLDENAKPLTPLITWEDSRSHQIARQLRNSASGKKIYKLTGTPIHSMAPICKIAWFQKNQRKLFNKTAKFVGIKEYLWYKMFGVFEIDHSVASATGLFNIQNLNWEKSALNFCGISADKLSNPVDTLHVRKNLSNPFKKATGLTDETIFCIGASDGCLANAGSQISKGEASVTIGTSGAVRITTTKPVVDFSSMMFNYILDEKHFVSGGPSNNGGNFIKWLFREILADDTPSEKDFEKLNEQTRDIAPGSEGLICLPYLYGERAPLWDEKATAVLFGLKATHTKYHIVRAVQEGIVFSLKIILDNLEKQTHPISLLYASGGFIHSKNWLQMMSDITGKKIVADAKADASATGAAMWAMKSLKKKVFVKKKNRNIQTIHPRKDVLNIYKKQFSIFKKLYPLTKQQMHLLNP